MQGWQMLRKARLISIIISFFFTVGMGGGGIGVYFEDESGGRSL